MNASAFPSMFEGSGQKSFSASPASVASAARGIAFSLALAIALATCACACALFGTSSLAYASSDVKTVHIDSVVYRGGYFDIEVEAVGFTATKYEWWVKAGEDKALAWYHNEPLYKQVEDDPTWFTQFNTNHLRLCTNNFEKDSEPDDFGMMTFYCVAYDSNGKKHYSDNFKINNIKGTQSFEVKYDEREAAGYGVSFASASPAQNEGTMTSISMHTGESKKFEFTVDNKVNAWLDESEPSVNTTIEIVSADKTVWEKHPGVKSWTFKPTKAGEYIIYMGAIVQLGYNYSTGKGAQHYYLVSVTDPEAVEPVEECIDLIGGSASAFTIDEPWDADVTPEADAQIPAVHMQIPSSFNSQLSSSIGWYRRVGSIWEGCTNLGETRFQAGGEYQLRTEFVAKDGYYFRSNLHGVGWTKYKTGVEYEGVTDEGRKVSRMGTEYMPIHSLSKKTVSFAVRSFTVADPDADPSMELPSGGTKKSYTKSDGTLAEDEFLQIDGEWYYFGSDNFAVTGWQDIGGKQYYFDDEGAMISNLEGVTPLKGATVTVAKAKYTGKAVKPAVTVQLYGKTLQKGVDFTVKYSDNKSVGTAKAKVTGVGSFSGSATKTFNISKAKPTAKVKKSTVVVKRAKVKKAAQAVANIAVKCDKGKASYKNAGSGAAKKFKVDSKTGKVTIPKGTKSGTYKVQVTVKVKASKSYTKLSKTVSFKVKVK